MNKKSNTPLAVFITFLITSLLYLLCSSFLKLPTLPGLDIAGGSDALGEISTMIDGLFYKETDSKELSQWAKKAYVGALEDPYSEYYTPEEFADLTASMEGNYKGIGIEVFAGEDNLITIQRVFEGSPAQKAGIAAGDKLVAFEGERCYADAMTKTTNAIKKQVTEKGTVTVTILRGEEEFDLTLEGGDISVNSAETKLLGENIGYIRLSDFHEKSADEFIVGTNTLINDGAKSLIIDLRDNPGGMLTSVVEIADYLLPEGNILTIKGRSVPKQEFKSDSKCIDIPLYVLVNGGSASASEVLAGALKDHGKAIIIGETTFGKGVVQSMYELKDGGALKITTSGYYTPSGKSIDGKGVEPDVKAEMELTKPIYMYSEEEDTQLQKAMELAKKKELPKKAE